ncbi:IF44L protein, partial [Polypterus senegalus]
MEEQEFSSRIRNELLEEIRNYKTLTESVEEPRILLVGQITAGKSSFFNSLNSVFRGHVMLQAASGYGDTSVSKQFNPKAPITRNDRLQRDPRLADKVHCVSRFAKHSQPPQSKSAEEV